MSLVAAFTAVIVETIVATLPVSMIALAGARQRGVHPELPVTAYLLEHNVGSKRVAERAGLQLAGGHRLGNPDPSAVRLVDADRALDDLLLDVLVQQ